MRKESDRKEAARRKDDPGRRNIEESCGKTRHSRRNVPNQTEHERMEGERDPLDDRCS